MGFFCIFLWWRLFLELAPEESKVLNGQTKKLVREIARAVDEMAEIVAAEATRGKQGAFKDRVYAVAFDRFLEQALRDIEVRL